MVEEKLKHIEIRDLEALRAVVEGGTFTDAGIRLGYSQAAVSQQVAALEAALGESVFDRPGGPRPVVFGAIFSQGCPQTVGMHCGNIALHFLPRSGRHHRSTFLVHLQH